MKKYIILVTIINLLFNVTLFAQKTADYKKHPGYVDFGNFEKFKNAEETVEVNIKGPMLKFISKATVHEDPELSKFLDDILLINVHVFSIEKSNLKEIKSIIKEAAKKLDPKKWERMIRVKERDEYVEFYAQFDQNDAMSGLVVMAVEKGNEAVFVNIVGNIDPDQLGKLSDKFNIPQMDSIEINRNKHNKGR